MSALALFFAAYMFNIIGTDLVVFKKPIVITSYSDIVNNDDVQVMFCSGIDDNEPFEHSDPDSIEGKIWNKRYMIDVQSVYWSMVKQRTDVMAQKKVAIMRDYFIETSMIFNTQQNKLLGLDHRIHGYMVRDETGKSFTEHLLYSAKSSIKWKKIVLRAANKMRESGIAEYVRKDGLLRELFENYVSTDEHYGSHIHKGSMPEPRVNVTHLDKLINSSIIYMFVALCVLFYEKLAQRNRFGVFNIGKRKHATRIRKRKRKIKRCRCKRCEYQQSKQTQKLNINFNAQNSSFIHPIPE